MRGLLNFIKRLFGVYQEGVEYYVPLNHIYVKKSFRYTRIGDKKYRNKWNFYRRNGYCESKIILNKDFVLLDGYSSYEIYRIAEGEDVKVPVYFKNELRSEMQF